MFDSNYQLGKFLEEMASDSPVPAGACAAAASGAMGAALLSMMGRLTIGKRGYEEQEELMKELLRKSGALTARLVQDSGADIQAYNSLMVALKLPRHSDSEKGARHRAIQSAWIQATKSPLAIAEDCLHVLALCSAAAEKGNASAASDVGVAALEARCGLEGAILSARFNLSHVEDKNFVAQTLSQLAQMSGEGGKYALQVQKLMEQHLDALRPLP